MSATLEAFNGDGEEPEEPTTAVFAECTACGDRHRVADRESADDTPASTVCPACGSPSYTSTRGEVGGE